MDFRQFRVLQTPRPVKAVILVMLLLQVFVGAACALFLLGDPQGEHGPSLLQASAYALGTGVPFLALALLLVSSRSGPRAWENKAGQLLLDAVPRQLARIDLRKEDRSKHLVRFQGRRVPVSRARSDEARTRVDLKLSPDGTTAYYRVTSDKNHRTLVLWLSIDAKPNQATICISAPARHLSPDANLQDLASSTLQGARISGGYTADEVERDEEIGGTGYRTVILRKTFDDEDFLWDPGENHFFSVDLGLMVASFMNECADLLAHDPAATVSTGPE